MLAAQAARFPEIEPVELDTTALDDREASFAHALYDAAIRRWLTLEFLLDSHLGTPFRRLEPVLRGVLLCGSAQIALLDRVPVHAAIDESVEWAKRHVRPGAAGLVNAVLRRVAGSLAEPTGSEGIPLPDGRERPLVGIALPGDPLRRLAVRCSMPHTLLRRWRDTLAPSEIEALCRHGLTRPPTVLSTRYAAGPLPVEHLAPHDAPHHAVWTGPHAALASLLLARGDVWVQDPASSGAIESVLDLEPGLVIDLCAGRGTKTRQLAAAFPGARIVATDTDPARFAALAQAFEDHPRVGVVEPSAATRQAGQGADLVLLDVPCSNTGVLGRRVEARYRATRDALERITRLQRELIDAGASMLAPDGAILYATCSVDRAENDAIAAWAAQRHGFRTERERRTRPAAPSGPASSIDGAYSVLLRR